MPNPGVGGHGVASEFGDLTGLARQAVSEFLCSLGASVKTTQGGYVEYKFTDRSKVIIRPDGEIVRIPAPRYDSTGSNLHKGLRLGSDGSLLPTKDSAGNLIPNTHNTRERVGD